jgi:hypothetical protein
VSIGMILLAMYAAGVVIGLIAVDGRPATKIGVALVWPLGLLAFVVTISALIVVAAIAFPTFGVVLAVAIVVTWLLLT